MENKLPIGWIETKLGNLFDFKYGKGLPKEKRDTSGTVNVFGSNGVVGYHSTSITKGKTIIIGRKGSVGEIHFCTEPCWPIDTTYFIDTFPSDVPPRYWMYYLKHVKLGRKDKSSAIPGISRDDIYSVNVPVPPLTEQSRIIAKLDALMAKVEENKTRLDKIPGILKRFKQSVLAAACSGRLTIDWRETHGIDKEWTTKPLSSLFKMKNGKSLTVDRRRDGIIPVYGGNGQMGTHNRANADGQIIVIGRVGAQCGNVHFISGNVWVTDNAISLEAKQSVEPEFYSYFLKSKNINQLSAGTGQPYVSQDILGPIETPIVSLLEQQEIVRRVNNLFNLTDKITDRYNQAKSQFDLLPQSILAKAFRGELVPQDPNDEPAEKLLERIRS